MWEVKLPHCLKDSDGNCIAEVQASRFRPHRKPDAAIAMFFQKILRQTLGFFAEEQIAVCFKIGFRVAPGGFGGETPHLLYIVFAEEIF